MKLRKFIQTTIRQYLYEHIENNNVKDILLKRIPFLKEYEIYEDEPLHEKRLRASKRGFNYDVNIKMGDEIINFPQFHVSSEVYYYPHKINDITFHYFGIKNGFYPMPPEDIDKLTLKAFIAALNALERKISYNAEIMVRDGEEFPMDRLDVIINDMNGVLFKMEELNPFKLF